VNTSKHPDLLEEARTVLANADRLFVRAEVEAALDRMANEINARLSDRNPLLLCIMIGGIVPTGLLLPRLTFPLQVDYLHVTRYRGDTSGGTLRWIKHPDIPLQSRVVLVVDDVLDEGITLAAIVEACQARGAREVLTAVLVEKRLERPAGGLRQADFVGLTAENRYLFGYGMDYKHYLRNADGIFALK
jgi:hypoxanthine phosphoribosyltransferase